MASLFKEDGTLNVREMNRRVGRAVAQEIEKHRLAGNSIPVYRSGKVVLIPPEKIKPLAEKYKE